MDTAKGPLPGAFPEEVEQEAPAWRESVLAQWRAETTDEQLVGIFAAAQEEAREAQDLAGKLEQELMRRAAERRATTIFGTGINFVVTTANEYDRTQLPPLLEYLSPEEKAECFVPAHPETVQVPDKYDMTKWKKAGRAHGGELQAGLDALTFPGRATGNLVRTDHGRVTEAPCWHRRLIEKEEERHGK